MYTRKRVLKGITGGEEKPRLKSALVKSRGEARENTERREEDEKKKKKGVLDGKTKEGQEGVN